MALTDSQTSALTQIATAAVACEAETDFPAEISTAQCILESAWLTRMAAPFNCFGIKATDSSAAYCITHEYLNGSWETCKLAFEAYPDLAACFAAHARLIISGKPYRGAWEQYLTDDPFLRVSQAASHRLDGLIQGIAPVYATDPNYAEQLLTLAHGPHVTAALEAARAKGGAA